MDELLLQKIMRPENDITGRSHSHTASSYYTTSNTYTLSTENTANCTSSMPPASYDLNVIILGILDILLPSLAITSQACSLQIAPQPPSL